MQVSDSRKVTSLLQQGSARIVRMVRYIGDLGVAHETAPVIDSLSQLKASFETLSIDPEGITADELDRIRELISAISTGTSGPAFAHIALFDGETPMTVGRKISDDCLSLSNVLLGIQIGVNKINLRQLEQLIPHQKVAAYAFEIVDGRILLKDQPAQDVGVDGEIIDAVAEVLIEQGGRILSDLQGSNCSPRLLQSFQSLHQKISERKNVVQVGILTTSCTKITMATADELSNTLLELLKAHLEAVYDYLSQHSSWRRFVENAVSVKLDSSDVADLVKTARSLARKLEDAEGSAAADVPEALRSVANVAASLDTPDGRIVLALARTVENLLSVVTRAAASLRGDLVGETRKWLARIVLAGGGYLALHTLAKVPGAEWVPEAVRFLLLSIGVT